MTFRALKIKKFRKGRLRKAVKKPISNWKLQGKAFNSRTFGKPMKPVRKGLRKNRLKFRRQSRKQLSFMRLQT